MTDDKQQANSILDSLPTEHDIRMSLADSMQDVQMLKQLLKIVEERREANEDRADTNVVDSSGERRA